MRLKNVGLVLLWNVGGIALIYLMLFVLPVALYPPKPAVEDAMEAIDRCWHLFDEGQFPSRGLYWVPNTPLRTYDDRGSGIRFHYGDEEHFSVCYLRTDSTGWSRKENALVLDTIYSRAPEWVSARNGIPIADVERRVAEQGVFRGQTLFLPKGQFETYLSAGEFRSDDPSTESLLFIAIAQGELEGE